MKKKVVAPVSVAIGAALLYLVYPEPAVSAQGHLTQGALFRIDPRGEMTSACPLKHTDVKAEISGFIARVTVTQQFENPSEEKIEAVYTFPLPDKAAVDDMTIKAGDRVIKAKIKRREEARAIYEAARAKGNVAGLLDQERPNIFTQSVANIAPGAKVTVQISYVETLKFDEGAYEFSFPMVVGPRYIPRQVTDAPRIAPPVAAKGERAGHDISLEVKLDAGVPIEKLRSVTHDVAIDAPSSTTAVIRLKDKAVIPNKDFVLHYDVSGAKIQDAVLAHNTGQDGYFTLMLTPPERFTVEDVTPKELVFVLDTSGSMSGFPIEKAKETMKLALEGLYPRDTFNLITFSGDTHVLFPAPVPATRENLDKAQQFLAARQGLGGTEMMKAIIAALEPSGKQDHIRIVCFMTDGYVGNDFEIISEIQKHKNARIFVFGIGNSVNRFLLDNMAREGRGEVEYVGLNDDGSAAARRLHERMRNPLLTDIRIDFSGVEVSDVYPERIPDLFSAKPVILTGRYARAGSGTVRLRGTMSGKPFERTMTVSLPASEPRHNVLRSLWARQRIGDLMSRDYAGLQRGNVEPQLKEQITQLGLDYRLVTQFTSFVAVEETTVIEGGEPRRVEVPVEMPEGVSHEGIYGERVAVAGLRSTGFAGYAGMHATGGFARGGVVGGVIGGVPSPAPMPSPRRVPAEKRRDSQEQLAISRLHPDVAAAISQLKKGATPSAAFIRDGKAYLQVWLSDASPELLKQIRTLGFETTVDPRVAKLLVGRIAVGKLPALAAMREVRYIAPQQP